LSTERATGVSRAETAARALFDLAVRIGAPVALKDIGMPADGLERAAELATQNPYANPRTRAR
jgi:alcohol dehydrogenase class IV